ncbi:conserved Plasmodium protein, unknown function [Plasmodium gallinaceum]|uniref:Reticulon domain-containing protein n=1 Tax=Plasmodium gallinaceum TaxID=5849 RepID=A0A1J1GNM4_PLAGA|nr:conserved Plasmodium protein, unknown function [Plasmodium gallinaceum]CRG93997.1 conserved Plasmodium protein, unknown function [Plasmodium gallinaceum]
MNVNSKNIVTLSIFSSINSLYILLYILNQTFLQIICTLCIMLLLLSGLVVFLKVHKISEYKEDDKLEIISKEKIEYCVIYLYEQLNDKLTIIRQYLLWNNRMKNITVIIIIYLLGNILSFINFNVFFYLLTWVIFLYNYINDTYINNAYKMIHPIYVNIKEQAKYLYDNIPKLQHLKKNI